MVEIIISILALIISAASAIFSYYALRSSNDAAYIQFFEIVSKHHSKDITGLRREVIPNLKREALISVEAKKALMEINPDFHLKASTLINYYESLGMLVEGGWDTFTNARKEILMQMLHSSVSKLWPLVDEYKDVIYPPEGRPSDWAESFQRLHKRIIEYRSNSGLK